MGKFFKQTEEEKQKSLETKLKRMGTGLKEKIGEVWKGLSQDGANMLFTQVWACPDLKKLEDEQKGFQKMIISKIRKMLGGNIMPGYRYKKLMFEIEKSITNHKKKTFDKENISYIRKEIKDFYVFEGIKVRTRKLTQIQIKDHREFSEMVDTIYSLIENNVYRKQDSIWLNKVLLKDLKESEFREQQKFMKDFGLN